MATTRLIKQTLTTALVGCLGVPALAETSEGQFYLRAFGGASFLSDSGLSGVVNGDAGFDTGQVVGGAFGYDYAGSPFRSELEFAYRTGTANSSSATTSSIVIGALRSWSKAAQN